MGFRHQDAALRQVLHQLQIKGQLLKRQTFEQGQHIVMDLAVLSCRDEVIGVFYAASAALHALQLSQGKLLQ